MARQGNTVSITSGCKKPDFKSIKQGTKTFEYDFKTGKFWYSHNRFYLVFKLNFGINIQEFEDLCKGAEKR